MRTTTLAAGRKDVWAGLGKDTGVGVHTSAAKAVKAAVAKVDRTKPLSSIKKLLAGAKAHKATKKAAHKVKAHKVAADFTGARGLKADGPGTTQTSVIRYYCNQGWTNAQISAELNKRFKPADFGKGGRRDFYAQWHRRVSRNLGLLNSKAL